MANSAILAELYSAADGSSSFSSAEKLREAAHQERGVLIPLKEIKEWLRGNDTYTRFRFRRKKFKRNPIIAGEIDEQWQGDLAELSDLSRYNSGFKYLFICIDVVSRFGFVEALKTKRSDEVTEAFQRILQRGRKPSKFQTDDGKEFLNSRFQGFLRNEGIEFFTVKSENKAALAERLVRTIKEKIWRYLDFNLTRRYIDHIQDFMKSYNNTYHKTLKMKPVEVTKGTVGKVLENLYGFLWKTDNVRGRKGRASFSVGDHVRLSLSKNPFEKGFRGNWTPEVFKIRSTQGRNPKRVYVVEDLHGREVSGTFYEDELQRVTHVGPGRYWRVERILRRRNGRNGVEYFVKWFGFDSSFNSWVPANEFRN